MSCVDFSKQISAYLDGELSADEKTAFQFHLENCPSCRKLLSTLEQQEKDLQDYLTPFRNQVQKAVWQFERERKTFTPSAFSPSAVLSIGIAVGILLMVLFVGTYFIFSQRQELQLQMDRIALLEKELAEMRIPSVEISSEKMIHLEKKFGPFEKKFVPSHFLTSAPLTFQGKPVVVSSDLEDVLVDVASPKFSMAPGALVQRKKAVQILSELSSPTGMDTFINLLRDPDPEIRVYAASGLQRITGQDFGFPATFWLDGKDLEKAQIQWKKWREEHQNFHIKKEPEIFLIRIKKVEKK